MTMTPAQAVERLGKASASIAGAGSEKALTAAGVESKQVMNRRGETLSGYGRGRNRGRVKAEARFDKAPGLRIIVEPTKRSRGLWALLEAGSARAGSQWNAPRRRGAGRRTRGTVGTYTREPVPARHTWTRATPAAADAAFRAYHRNIVQSTFRELRHG